MEDEYIITTPTYEWDLKSFIDYIRVNKNIRANYSYDKEKNVALVEAYNQAAVISMFDATVGYSKWAFTTKAKEDVFYSRTDMGRYRNLFLVNFSLPNDDKHARMEIMFSDDTMSFARVTDNNGKLVMKGLQYDDAIGELSKYGLNEGNLMQLVHDDRRTS